MIEKWADYSGLRVSSSGRICILNGRILKPRINSDGYLIVVWKLDIILVHKAVLDAFIGRPFTEVFFMDGDPTNVSLLNLDWR
jgi:hypothetical protein